MVVAILVDLAERTQQYVNPQGQRIAQVTKSLKTLIMNASLGAGSELEVEVAKGVDWTAILAIIMGVKQVPDWRSVYDMVTLLKWGWVGVAREQISGAAHWQAMFHGCMRMVQGCCLRP